MYIDKNTIRFYYLNYMYKLKPQFFPSMCPYRQMPPIKPLPQVPQGAPSSMPPNFIPAQPHSHQFGNNPLAVNQGEIRPCIYRFIYIWSITRGRFWAWLIFVGPRTISGFRWITNTWKYFVMDSRNIISLNASKIV